jgi:hypothetical protein
MRWAHFEWIFRANADRIEPGDSQRWAPDLIGDPVYGFLERYYAIIQIALGLGLLWAGGWSWLIWGTFVRLIVTYHCTWLVSSASHAVGYRTFRTSDRSTNNWWVALLTFGEGWHNNHHAFPFSARHGLRWFEFDLTFLIVRFLRWTGLAANVRLPSREMIERLRVPKVPRRGLELRANGPRMPHRLWTAALLAVTITLQACAQRAATLPAQPRQNSAPLAGTVVQRGTVVLPPGSSLTPAQLTVKNSLGLTTPALDGSFAVNQFPGGPQFAFVTDPAGNAILAGFVGPGSTTIDATSSAKVLLYWSTGCFTLPGPLRAQTIDDLANQPGFAAVRDAFANGIIASPDPFATAMNRLTLASAIGGYTQALYASSATRAASASGRARSAVGISPVSAQSGISTLNDFPAGLHFTNTYRRLAEAFIDEDSYVDAQGNRIAKALTDAVAPTHIAAVSGLTNAGGGPISVALSLLGGTTPYAPVTTTPFSLPLEPGSQSTRYRVTVIGAGKANSNVSLTAEQTNAQKLLVLEQLVQDYLVPLVASIAIPVNATQIDDYLASPDGGAAIASIAMMADSAAPQIYPVANSGQVGDALVLGMNALAGNPAMQTALLGLVGLLLWMSVV